GKDEHIRGFRYYVSRPYIVVAQRVCVWQSLTVGRLRAAVTGEKGKEVYSDKLYIETIKPDGTSVVYDTHGRQLPPGERENLNLVDALSPPKAPHVPPAPVPKVTDGTPPPPKTTTPPPAVPPSPQTISFAALRKVVADETPIPTFQYVMLPDFEEQ